MLSGKAQEIEGPAASPGPWVAALRPEGLFPRVHMSLVCAARPESRRSARVARRASWGGGAGVQSKPSDTERAPKPDPSSAKQPRGFSQASRGMTPQGFASFPTGRQAAEGAPSRTRRRLSPAGETSGGRGGLGANILLEGSASAVTTNPFGGLGPRAPRRDARVNWPVCAQGQVPGHSARGPISPEVVSWGRPLLKKRERSLKTAFFFSLQDDGEENNPRLRVDGEPLEIKARAFAHVEFAGRGGGRLGVDLPVKLAKGHGRREATWRLSRGHKRVNPRETSLPKSAGPGGAFGCRAGFPGGPGPSSGARPFFKKRPTPFLAAPRELRAAVPAWDKGRRSRRSRL